MDHANSSPQQSTAPNRGAGRLKSISIDSIIPDPEQPRKIYDDLSLQELAETIKEIGIIQAPVVRPMARRGRYILVAGERRWRAAKLAGLSDIDVKIHDGDDYRSVALIENLQREDLTPVEEATAVRDLIEQDPAINQSNVWQIIGKSRQTVNQLLKINTLPTVIKDESISLSIPKTILIELSQLSDEEEQLRLWDRAKIGKLRVSDIRNARADKTTSKNKSDDGASKLATLGQTISQGDKFFGMLADLDPAKMTPSERAKLSELATTLARTFSSLKRKLSQHEGPDF